MPELSTLAMQVSWPTIHLDARLPKRWFAGQDLGMAAFVLKRFLPLG
jgi:hypothetical protein